ncbi:MAG TPA: hypothetical protein P5121_17315 [Caldilineaceae bacterium]|nr:hypothetical protein [Caldilineaceae bacterium]
MSTNPWVRFLLGELPAVDANRLAQKMGLSVIAQDPVIAGSFQGRYVRLTIQPTHGRNGRFIATIQVAVEISSEIVLTVNRTHPIAAFFRRHRSLPEQTGRTMVEEQFHIATQPPPLRETLLNSASFCYALLLFPLPAFIIQKQCLQCQQVVTYTFIEEVVLELEKVNAFAAELEQIMTGLAPA